jgi:hypothetical protein
MSLIKNFFLTFVLCFFILHLKTSNLFAKLQQSPPQNALSIKNHPNQMTKIILDKPIKITWPHLEHTHHHILVISQDEDFKKVVEVKNIKENFFELQTINVFSAKNTQTTKFYYYVLYYSKYRLMQKSKIFSFEIPNYSNLSNSLIENKTQEIQFISPLQNEIFPPKPKIRFAWLLNTKTKQNLKAYQIKIWQKSKNEKAIKNEIPPAPLWITTTQESWLEVEDVPYGSYKYLEPDDYQFEVAPIYENEDSKEELGGASYLDFEVSRSYYLIPNENIFRFSFLFLQPTHTQSYSNEVTPTTAQNYSSQGYGFNFEIEKYFNRIHGLYLKLNTINLKLEPEGSPFLFQGSLNFIERAFLSYTKPGTTFSYFFGLSFNELPQVLKLSPQSQIATPISLGPNLGFYLNIPLFLNYSFETNPNLNLSMFTTNTEKGTQRNYPRLSFDINAKLKTFNEENNMGLFFGTQFSNSSLSYLADKSITKSGAQVIAFSYIFGLEIRN